MYFYGDLKGLRLEKNYEMLCGDRVFFFLFISLVLNTHF